VPNPVVVDDVTAAAALVARGVNVVVVVDPDADPVRLPPAGPGRVALMVGRLADPEVRAAAEAMAAELFGGH
jgi:hypothetical protein